MFIKLPEIIEKDENKSARSVTKSTKDASKPPRREFRPNSSKRGGLAEAIQQEYEVEKGEVIEPEPNTIAKGMDFNGGDSDEYENDFDRTMEHNNQEVPRVTQKNYDQSLEIQVEPENKEFYSKKANEDMNDFYKNDENHTNNNDTSHYNAVNPPISQISKPSFGQKSKPSFAKVTSKPNFGFPKKI
mmetsp:Transcript_26798/g.23659  ORF Transcript_26798/g.23659 Transcript_26798/m.23659 type:complete len:187 (+) Transcript_26798:168-728(+)